MDVSTNKRRNEDTNHYNLSMKDIKEDLNHWREMLCSWMRELDAVQMSVPTNCTNVNVIPMETPRVLILKFIMKSSDIKRQDHFKNK